VEAEVYYKRTLVSSIIELVIYSGWDLRGFNIGNMRDNQNKKASNYFQCELPAFFITKGELLARHVLMNRQIHV
jgi:hypothetical protein